MRTVTAKEVADELGMTEEEVCSVMNEGFLLIFYLLMIGRRKTKKKKTAR